MTATMTPDIITLLAAIDDGDDSAMPALADAMEEAGISPSEERPASACVRWWSADSPVPGPEGSAIPAETFRRLWDRRGDGWSCASDGGLGRYISYDSRAAACLALAAVLAEALSEGQS